MRTRTKENIKIIVKWFLIAIVIIFSAVISMIGTATHSRPIILIPVAVCIAMSHNELLAGILGAVCGLIIDMTCGTIIGINGVLLTVFCVVISLLCMHFIKNNLVDAVLLTGGVAVLQALYVFFFNYVLWGEKNYKAVLTTTLIPSVVWTILVSPVVYLLLKLIISKLSIEEKIEIESK